METDDGGSDCESEEHYQSYASIPYGLQLLAEYYHASKHCQIQDITHNVKTNEYILLDSRGISSWTSSFLNSKRLLDFEQYSFNTLRSLLYSRYYNVYFALTKDYNLKVFNLNFHEIASAEYDGSFISRLLYNTELNELIGLCRNKLRFWKYAICDKSHVLTLIKEFQIAESLLVSNAEFDNALQRIYLLCDNDIWCYSTSGRCIFHLKSQSSTYFSVCTFSKEANLVIAGAINGQLSIYSTNGGLVTMLLNHSRMVTAVVVHPCDGNMFISASMDGTIKLFSLQMFGELSSINVFPDGIYWMKIQSNHVLYCSSMKSIQLYDLNYTFQFWSTVRSPVKSMNIVPKQHNLRSYVLVNTTDNSIRLYSKETGQRRCTILPPPEVSANSDILSVAFDRGGRVMYVLFTPTELWIYSTRTDPATRVATWNIEQSIRTDGEASADSSSTESGTAFTTETQQQFGKSTVSQREADENIRCCCLLIIRREIYMQDMPSDDYARFGLLLCGLSNGTISFLDPCKQESVFKSLKAHSSSPVVDIRVHYNRTFTHLTTLIHTITHRLVRIWDAATFSYLYQVEIPDAVSVFCYKNFQFVTGETTGCVSFEAIEVNKQASILASSDVSLLHNHNSNIKDHNGEILDVDILEGQNVILSCGADSYIRIWNSDKVLLTEIKFDESLQSALFLRNDGTLLISFKTHLFVVPHYLTLRGFPNTYSLSSSSESSGDESVIYEDPNVRKERKTAPRTMSNITLSNYLVPYPNLGLESLWMFEKALADQDSNAHEETNDGDRSDDSMDSLQSFASTAVYQDSVASEMSFSRCCSQTNFPRCNSTPHFFKDEPATDVEPVVNKSSEKGSDSSDDKKTDVKRDENKENKRQSNFESLYDQIRNREGKYKNILTVKGKNGLDFVALPPQISSQKRMTKKKKAVKRAKKSKGSSKPAHLSDQNLQDQKQSLSVNSAGGLQPLSSTDGDKHQSLGSKFNVDMKANHVEATSSGKDDKNKTNVPVLNLPDEKPQTLAQPNDELNLKKQSKSKLSTISKTMLADSNASNFSPHHKSLAAMAMGKSKRGISRSFQDVMKALTEEDNILPTKSTSTSSVEITTNPSNSNIFNTSISKPTVRLSQHEKLCESENFDKERSNYSRKIQTEHDKELSNAKNAEKIMVRKSGRLNTNSTSQFINTTTTPKSNIAGVNQGKISQSSTTTATTTTTTIVPWHHVDEDDEENHVTYKTRSRKNQNDDNVSQLSDNASPQTPTRVSSAHSRPQEVRQKKSLKTIIQKHFLSSESQQSSQSKATENDDITTVILNLSNKLRYKQQEQQKMNARKQVHMKKNVGFAISSVSNVNQAIKRGQEDSAITSNDVSDVHSGTNSNSAKRYQKTDSRETSMRSNLSEDFANSNLGHIVDTGDESSQQNKSHRKTSIPFKLLTKKEERGKQFVQNDDGISVNSIKPMKRDQTTSYDDTNTTAEVTADAEQKRCVMSFILGAFKKTNTTQPVPAVRSNQNRKQSEPSFEMEQNFMYLKLDNNNNNNTNNNTTTTNNNNNNNNSSNTNNSNNNNNNNNAIVENDFAMDKSTSFSFGNSFDDHREDLNLSTPRTPYFITPRNSMQCSSISNVTISHHQYTDEQTSDESINHESRNNNVLFLKLNKHRLEKEKRQSRQEKMRMRRSTSALSSGYETGSQDTFWNSQFSMRRLASASSKGTKKRLTIRRNPLAIEDVSSTSWEQVPIQNNSERVYYDYANSSRKGCHPSRSKEDKNEKIRNLELKLSGQPFRYNYAKTAEEMECNRLMLLFLKGTGGMVLKPPRTAASIPNRCQYKLIKGPKPPSKQY